LGPLVRAFTAQLRRLLGERRLLALLGLFLAASWVTMDAYSRLLVRDVPIAFLDLDNSAASRTLHRFLGATRELQLVAETPASLEEAQALLVSGRAAGVVLVPDDFSSDLKRGRRAVVVVAMDFSNIVSGKTALRAIQKAIATVGGGAQLQLLRRLGEPRLSAAARVQPILISDALEQNPAANYAVYVVPGLLFFFLHLLALFYAWDAIWPQPAPEVFGRSNGELLARLAAGTLVALGLGLLLAYGFLWRVEIAPRAPLQVVAVLLLSLLVADAAMALAFRAAFPRPITGLQATVVVGMLSLMLSGLTWPLDAFPAPLRWVGLSIPFTPFVYALRTLLGEQAGFADLQQALPVLAAQTAGFAGVIAAVALLRRSTAQWRRA
jgi:ABC-2 type transport system permease protein